MTDAIHSVPYTVVTGDIKFRGGKLYWRSYLNYNICDKRHNYTRLYNYDFEGIHYDKQVVWRTDNVTCFKCLLVIKAIQRGDI